MKILLIFKVTFEIDQTNFISFALSSKSSSIRELSSSGLGGISQSSTSDIV